MENGIGPLIWLTDLSTHGFRMSICMSKQGKVSCYYAQFSKQFALYAVYITILALFCDAQAILGWPTGSVESRCGTMTCTNVYHMINYGSSLKLISGACGRDCTVVYGFACSASRYMPTDTWQTSSLPDHIQASKRH